MPLQTKWRRAVTWAVLAVLSGSAGYVCARLTIPAAWMVGPMLVAIVYGLVGLPRLTVPRPLFAGAQTVVGILIAGMFRVSDLPILAHHWYAVVLVGGGTLVLSVAIGRILARVARLDELTAVLGALPGGASGMVAMSSSLRADPKLVAIMQYVRLILVVLSASLITRELARVPSAHPVLPAASGLSFPWYDSLLSLTIGAVGAWLAARLRVPAGALLGSIAAAILSGASGLVHITVPTEVSAVAYALIGLYVGLMFDRPSLRHAGALLPYIVASTLLLIFCCGTLGWVLNALTGDGLLTCLLATSPGGLDSVTLTAIGGGANIALVVSLQTVRLFSIVFLGPVLVRWLARRHGRQTAAK